MNLLIFMAIYHGVTYTALLCFGPIEDVFRFEIVLKTNLFFSCLTLMQSELALLFVLILKYLSIYHSTFTYSLNEDKTVKGLVVMIFVLALTSTSFEYACVTSMEYAVMYQIMLSSTNSHAAKVEKVKIVTFILIFIVSGILQARLGLDKKKNLLLKWCYKSATNNQEEQNATENVSSQNDYKPKILRWALIAFSSIYILAIYQTYVGSGSVTANLAFAFCVAYIFLPIIFIYNHPNIRNFCISKLIPSICFLRRN